MGGAEGTKLDVDFVDMERVSIELKQIKQYYEKMNENTVN